jgi:hypothetical protein
MAGFGITGAEFSDSDTIELLSQLDMTSYGAITPRTADEVINTNINYSYEAVRDVVFLFYITEKVLWCRNTA